MRLVSILPVQGGLMMKLTRAALMEEASMYYANILMPFAPLITRKIQEVVDMKIPIDMIAPSHGIIWRQDPMKIVNAYLKWSAGESKNKVVIVFDTMWHSTDTMARAIADGIISQGVEAKLYKLRLYEHFRSHDRNP